jgi:hypothetical protein
MWGAASSGREACKGVGIEVADEEEMGPNGPGKGRDVEVVYLYRPGNGCGSALFREDVPNGGEWLTSGRWLSPAWSTGSLTI